MVTEKDLESSSAFQLLDTLDLSSGEYLIMGSGIMFALGIRSLTDLNDIDLFVPSSTWEKVRELSENIYDPEWKVDHLYLFNNIIDIWNGWGPSEYNFEDLYNRAYFVGKYPFLSIQDTLDWKRTMGREKDLMHIKMIEDYLVENK